METADQHAAFMREAIRMAAENIQKGGGPFGAVIVHDGLIIGRGTNRVTSSMDPTSHAEINAIRDACTRLGHWQLEGCTLYSSCEPCPMCLGAIYWSRPAALFYANTRADAAAIRFDDEFIYREISLPLDSRSIPTRQLLREEGLRVFASWEAASDKVLY